MINITVWVIPFLILMTLILALKKKQSPFESFSEGVRDGLKLVREIFPSIMGMLLAVNVLRASGFIEDFGMLLSEIIPGVDWMAQLTPMMLFRPISGSASMAVLQDICKNTGPDSFLCRAASTIQGSTDTTLYVLALYFGSISVKKWRHALPAGLIADAVGMSVAILLALLFFS